MTEIQAHHVSVKGEILRSGLGEKLPQITCLLSKCLHISRAQRHLMSGVEAEHVDLPRRAKD